MADQVFWQRKSLAQMTSQEWESLCDGCGKCCLHKLENEDTDEVFYTDVACQLLDHDNCRCQDYPNRRARVADCLVLTPEDAEYFHWLPVTCAYRLIAAGEALPDWHPLLTGDPNSTHKAGMSVAGKVLAEESVATDDLEEHIIHWVI
ncbi:YcgN family cysteine cluster protein [Gilvimarinus sp. SDUM040013]|uniref:UPF0260 protein SCD92_02225 n=1 Tax=Gilvimarinus gilvus TaxID=3058038 RepID=A0ABU4RTF1_9GAMM|nr:YcgN family cysteine cluster protein [Gilvimarinus sp. SDUM040013]MDO3386948.1 YcgN family cysteine cluster protein [Gilvimarinus sp. SDUM040013]MDX6848158.1 YcgN family cysteine cluster protein [Gilvimarinus sp. SDUM040013]